MSADESGRRNKPGGSPLRLVSTEPLDPEVEQRLVSIEQLRLALREEIRAGPPPSRRLFDLAAEWLPAKLRDLPGSWDSFSARVTNHLLPALGQHTSASLRPKHVDALMADLLARGFSEQTANHVRDAGRQLIEWAIDNEEWPAPNPFLKVAPRDIHRDDGDVLTAPQAARFLEAVEDRWRNLFALAIYLGPRRGEDFALQKTWVDFERVFISFNGSHGNDRTKTGGRRKNIPIPVELLPYLRDAFECAGSSIYVFPAEDGNRLSRNTKLANVTREALLDAGLLNPETGEPMQITFHGLRRVSSSLHQEAGCHPWVVSKVLGHSQASLRAAGNPVENTTAKHYTKFSEEFIRSELNKLSLKVRS